MRRAGYAAVDALATPLAATEADPVLRPCQSFSVGVDGFSGRSEAVVAGKPAARFFATARARLERAQRAR